MENFRGRPQKIFTLTILFTFLAACMGNARVLEMDETAKAIEISEQQARLNLACPSAKAGKTLRSEHLTDAGEPLHSIYRVWVEGCGKHAVYEVMCNDDDLCSLVQG